MTSIGIGLSGLLPTPSDAILAIFLIVVGLVVAFAGRLVVKALIVLSAGLAGGLVGLVFGAAVLGPIGALLGALVGFIMAAALAYFLISLGVGIAIGYFAFDVARSLGGSLAIAILVGVVFFVVGALLSNKVLEVATAILGGLMVYNSLLFFALPSLVSLAAAIVVMVAGYFVQSAESRRRQWAQSPPAQTV